MPPPDKSAAELLATPVQFLKGVGPQRAEVLAAARTAHRTRRALLLPADLPGHDRHPRRRSAGGRQAAKRLRRRSRSSSFAAASRAAACWACSSARPPATSAACGSTSRSCRRSSRSGSASSSPASPSTRAGLADVAPQGRFPGRRKRSAQGPDRAGLSAHRGHPAMADAEDRRRNGRRIRQSAGRDLSRRLSAARTISGRCRARSSRSIHRTAPSELAGAAAIGLSRAVPAGAGLGR